MMNSEELLKLFPTASEPDELLDAFEGLLATPDEAADFVTRQLDAFTADPTPLAEEPARKQLRCVFLLAGLLKRTEHFLPIFRLVCLPAFQEKVPPEDWLITELSRIFGLLSPAHCLDDLMAKTLDASVPPPVMEQLALTIVFRWLADRDSDRDFQATVQALLKLLPPERVTYDLGMALIIDAIAVGGEQLRPQVMAFYQSNQDKFSAELPEKNLKSFFDLGKQRVKTMLRGNYLGDYGALPGELQRMLHQQPVEEGTTSVRKTLPPIVRDRPKVGRNDPCPCGSGKKYKHCCGR
ncbi:MAG: SEC-C domain-containing protein [Victivallales bacterium]|nr:SEC-C domain-containing protein [Victivallales bacterium]